MLSFRSISSIAAAATIAIFAAYLSLSADPNPTGYECDTANEGCREPNKGPAIPQGTGFDFYVLSLSWSPTWCAQNDPGGKSTQCNGSQDYGFIVHGLWPENENGAPQYCASREPDRVPDALYKSMIDIVPSAGLAGHEWRKHGTCSGLDQKNYFLVLRSAWNSVDIPPGLRAGKEKMRIGVDEAEKAILAANPGMSSEGISVTCKGGYLEELRICLEKDLNFRTCPQLEQRGCTASEVNLPPIP